ncbi:metallophosphoesterase [Clostridioides difficile]
MNFKNKAKVLSLCLISISISMILTGCTNLKNEKITKVNILATTDLHGEVTYNVAEKINEERKKDSNITLVDAGDFYDSDGLGAMNQYLSEARDAYEKDEVVKKEVPIVRQMSEVKYDAVVLGNHEFVSSSKKNLDKMINEFNNKNIDVLSANIYNSNNSSYVKPYTIKKIEMKDGEVKLGILGLTIKEVGERWSFDENGNKIKAKSRGLKDMVTYQDLYMNDMIEDAKKWVKEIKERENPDILLAVVHSGEKPKKPKNPGNRIQELAKEVDGIDAIVAGHTHKEIEQHDYTNNKGESVIVTQPGSHSSCISKITFELKKDNNTWKVQDKYSKLTKLEEDKSLENFGDLIKNLYELNDKKSEVNLSSLSKFKWDRAYLFSNDTSVEKMYNIVGYKWKNLIDIENDNRIKMVFMKNEKVFSYACFNGKDFGIDLKVDKSKYKDGVLEIIPKKNDKFEVKKNSEGYDIQLVYK